MKQREEILGSARKLGVEIGQIFTDIGYWNNNVRKHGEPEIDPDPDGILRRIKDGIDRVLAEEDKRPLPPFVTPEDKAAVIAALERVGKLRSPLRP